MFQFGLRSMLAVMLAAAALFGIVFALPGELSVLVLSFLHRLLVPLFVAAIVYARGYARAFAIGGLTWIGMAVFADEMSGQYYNPWGATTTMFSGSFPLNVFPQDSTRPLIKLLFAGISGLLGIGTRFLSQPMTPAVDGEEARERLPWWMLPVVSLVLILAGMIGWLSYADRVQQSNLMPSPMGIPGMPGVTIIPPAGFPSSGAEVEKKASEDPSDAVGPGGPPRGMP